MADLPLPGEELIDQRSDPAIDVTARLGEAQAFEAAVPPAVTTILRTLWSADHAAYVVGGSVRDVLLGRNVDDWDVATSARPEQTQGLFPAAIYENAFGTVAVATDDAAIPQVEVTTFRSDHDYADFRRPHRVEFTDSIDLDLARRDITINAIAWGAAGGSDSGTAGVGDTVAGGTQLVDPFGGRADLAAGLLRTVGDPGERFDEDALRMLRVVRFAATLGFTIATETYDGLVSRAHLVAHLSGERIAQELLRILAAPVPSVGLRLLADTGLLAPISPALAEQRGIPQRKIEGEDLWDHTLRAVDGAATAPSYIRMAALLHDIGKPSTMADGRFLGHDTVGAAMADEFLERLRWPRRERDRIVHLVRNHMYGYVPSWSDAAVRRFIAKVGRESLDDLFLLREADNVGSGRDRVGGGLAEIRARVAAQLSAGVVLGLADLAIDGDVLMRELDIPPSPRLGSVLDALLERAVADPSINDRDRLLALARSLIAEGIV